MTELERENLRLISELKKVQNENSELQLRTLQLEATVDSIPDAYFVFDNDSNIIHINKSAQRILKFSEKEKQYSQSQRFKLLNFKSFEGKLLPLEKTPLFRAQKGEIIRGEVVQVSRKNKIVWLSVSAAPAVSPEGIKQGAVLEISDITKLKEAELEVRESESQLKQLADSMPQLIWITRPDGYHEYFNKRWYEFTGTKEGEAYGDSWLTVLHPDDYQRSLNVWKHSLETGKPYSIEYRFKRGSDNTYHWFLGRAVAVYNKKGKITRWFGTCTNIQELKETEQALIESQKRYRLVNKATRDIIWEWDLLTDQVTWNEAIETALDKSRNELNQTVLSWHKHIHPDDKESTVESIHHAIKTGKSEWNSEYRFGPEGGPWRTYFDRGFIAYNNNGKAYRMIGSMIDLTERREAGKALEKSQRLFHDVLNVLPVGVFVADEEGNLALTNPAAEKLWGGAKHIPIDKLNKYKGWWRNTGQQLQAEDWAFARAFLKGESSENEEIDIECFDGSRKTILNFAAPVRNSNGEIISAVAAAMDITNRIKAEEALRENEERIRAALEGGNLGSWELNLMTGNATTSLRHDQILGYPHGTKEWSLELFLKRVIPEDRSMVKQTFKQAYETGSFSLECRIVWPDGTLFWISANGRTRYDQQGKPVSVTGVVADITDRKTAEEALRESEERFRNLADNISQLAWMADENGNIVWYNKRWFDYTGSTPEEMEDWRWTTLIHHEYNYRVIKSMQHAFDRAIKWEETFPLKGKDDKYRWFLTRALPIKDQNGNLIRWFGTNTDITEQRESEIQLKKAHDLFENILYILAHDLKGPIANMHMATNLIQTVEDLNKKTMLINSYKPMLDRMDNTIKGVTDILQVQKTEGSSARIVDMESLINDILIEFKNELKPGELKYDFQDKRIINYIEPFLLSILRNLINNSIKYRREDVPLEIEIKTGKKKEYTLLSVKDNGIGMNLEKYRDQLFTPFMRITSRKTEGTGIGLYIIKTIIEKNGGYISVESTPGAGTTFYCYLREYNL